MNRLPTSDVRADEGDIIREGCGVATTDVCSPVVAVMTGNVCRRRRGVNVGEDGVRAPFLSALLAHRDTRHTPHGSL